MKIDEPLKRPYGSIRLPSEPAAGLPRPCPALPGPARPGCFSPCREEEKMEAGWGERRGSPAHVIPIS